jgi:5-methylcytosine-specific restriction protein A
MPNAAPVHNPRTTKKRTQLAQAKHRQQKRLYATNHPVWRRIREDTLRREPLCRECNKHGRITAGDTVDHINGDTYNNSSENLQALCKACHDRKTGRETGFGSDSEKVRY